MQKLPDMNELMKLAQSPAGQKLLAMLSGNTQDLDSITADAAAGNMQEAGRKLSGLLDSEEARSLINDLKKQL